MPLNQVTNLTKAMSLFEALKSKDCDTSSDKIFIASKAWFDRFWKSWHNINVQGEAASADTKAARDFPQHLAEIVEKEGCCSRQVTSTKQVFTERKCHRKCT
jgi:hypothetical protein